LSGHGITASKRTAQPIGRFAKCRQRCACSRMPHRRIVLILCDALLAILVAIAVGDQQEHAGITVRQYSIDDDFPAVVDELAAPRLGRSG
jgi:hypothetical protein